METISDSLLMILFAFIALCLFVLLGGVIYGLVALPFYLLCRLYKRFRGDPTGNLYKCIVYKKDPLEGQAVTFERVTGKQKKIIKKGCNSFGYQLKCKESERLSDQEGN